MNKISMGKKYTYKNGNPARILCVDGYLQSYPVISMDESGGIHSHDLNGASATGQDALCLVGEWKPKKDEWCLFSENGRMYVLSKFKHMVNGSFMDHNNVSWLYCYKFDGTFPRAEEK